MKNNGNQLKFGALISYLSILFTALTALFYTPWMVNKIGTSNYALYNTAYSFINMFLIDFGLGTAVSRFVAKYRAEGNERKVDETITIVTRLYLIIDLFIFIVLFVIYFFLDVIYVKFTPQELETFRVLYLIVGTFSIISFPFTTLQGILTAYEEFIPLKLCDLGQKMLSILLIIIALMNNMGVTALVSCNAISGIFFIIIRLLVIHKRTNIHLIPGVRDKELMKSVLGFSVWTAIVSICSRLSFNLAYTILGNVSGTEEIAIFSPASNLESIFYMFAAAVNGLFLARISKYIADNQEDRIFTLMVKVGRYQLAVMGLVFIGFACIGRQFMVTWMGPEFEKSAFSALLIFIPDLLLFTQQIANTTVIAKNKVKYQAFSYIAQSIICVGLSFPLSRRFGAVGACLSIAVSYLFSFIYMNFVYSRQLHLNIPLFFKQCYGSFIIPDIICFAGCWYLCNHVLSISGWKGIIIYALIITVIYAVLIWLMALNKDEKAMISNYIRRKKD